jgi:predicted DNA-binding transcriptional regulator AlpA
MIEPDALLDIRDVARKLRVSTRHVSTLEKLGSIPKAIRVGRCLRWSPRAIADFILNGGRSTSGTVEESAAR